MGFDPRQRRDGRPMRFQRPPFQQRRQELPVMDEDEPDSEFEQRGGSRESEYLRSLADEKTPVVVHLRTGETFRGFIEYYDKRFLRLTRSGAPNLFIFKQDITYLSEEGQRAEGNGSPAKELLTAGRRRESLPYSNPKFVAPVG